MKREITIREMDNDVSPLTTGLHFNRVNDRPRHQLSRGDRYVIEYGRYE